MSKRKPIPSMSAKKIPILQTQRNMNANAGAVLAPMRSNGEHVAVYDFSNIQMVLNKLTEIPLPYNTIAPIIEMLKSVQIYEVQTLNRLIEEYNDEIMHPDRDDGEESRDSNVTLPQNING